MPNRKLLLILEAGVNHDGDLNKAFALIESASRTGAQFIKFQTYSAERLAAPVSPSYWDTSEEPTLSQIELFKKYDGFQVHDYEKLAEKCAQLGIGFMSTCFDEQWVDDLDHLQTIYKVASADITNFGLIKKIVSKGKPIILSTGASSLAEIEKTLSFIHQLGHKDVTLLHCVLNYPTSADSAHLGRLLAMSQKFPQYKLGYSDHTTPKDSGTAIELAYALGARTVEKHFTLDKTQKGNDHYHSYDEGDVIQLLSRIEYVDILLDFDEGKYLTDQEDARSFARRGLYASRPISAGTVISEDMLIALRPTTGLSGFSADQLLRLIGQTTSEDLDTYTAITKKSLKE